MLLFLCLILLLGNLGACCDRDLSWTVLVHLGGTDWVEGINVVESGFNARGVDVVPTSSVI